jgi:hypothetical protein
MRLPPTPACRVCFRPCVFNKFSHFWQRTISHFWQKESDCGSHNKKSPTKAKPVVCVHGGLYGHAGSWVAYGLACMLRSSLRRRSA